MGRRDALLRAAALAAASLSLACTRSSREGPPPAPAGQAAPSAPDADRSAAGAASGAPAPGGVEAALLARKLVRTGSLTVEVASYPRASEEVSRLAEAHGGYLAETQATRGTGESLRGTLTVRVPAGRFGAAVAELKKLGKVVSESMTTQDVTRAYADLETRLRVKRETAERLRELLRDRTARLSEVLEVERELSRLTEEIERAEGERRYYDQLVALSTVAVTLQEPEALLREGAFSPLREAAEGAARVLAVSLAAMVYAAVFLAPWVLVLWGLWRLLRRLRRRGRPAPGA